MNGPAAIQTPGRAGSCWVPRVARRTIPSGPGRRTGTVGPLKKGCPYGHCGFESHPGHCLFVPELRTERTFRGLRVAFAARMMKGRFPIIVEAIRSMRLKAVRCTECGDARWCLFSTADPASPCELCGGEMKVERRTPGGGPRQLLRERRSAAPGLMPGSRAPLAG